MYMFISYLYIICIYIYMYRERYRYIYIYRERERYRYIDRSTHTHTHTRTHESKQSTDDTRFEHMLATVVSMQRRYPPSNQKRVPPELSSTKGHMRGGRGISRFLKKVLQEVAPCDTQQSPFVSRVSKIVRAPFLWRHFQGDTVRPDLP